MAKVREPQPFLLIAFILTCAQPDKARVSTNVLTRDHQQRIDLVYPSDDSDGSPDEVVLALQGFLIQADLPPIVNSHL